MPVASEIEIQSAYREYKVKIYDIHEVLNLDNFEFVIADEMLLHAIGDLSQAHIALEADERHKNLDTCAKILEQMSSDGINRSSRVAGIGGGFIQDVATFATSTYMRGVSWTYLPTTMMSVLDSCIGGKSSINLGRRKNVLGNYWPPSEINIFPGILRNLSDEAVIAGLCEGVKICYAHSDENFEEFLQFADVFLQGRRLEVIPEMVHLSLASKKWFVEIDEHDQQERQLLNFGHTFGHALEAALDFSIPHGIAVGLGMLAASRHSVATKSARLNLLVTFLRRALSRDVEKLAFYSSTWDRDIFIKNFEGDKKHTNSAYTLILPQGETLQRVSLEKTEIVRQEILEIMNDAFQEAMR